MSFIRWSETLEVKIEEIDNQHKRLVDIANKFSDGIKKGISNEFLEVIIDELIAYSNEHFETEEKYLKQYDYPNLEEHQKEHIRLTNDIKEFKNKLVQNHYRTAIELLEFIKDWLIDHLNGEDHKFYLYLRNNKFLK